MVLLENGRRNGFMFHLLPLTITRKTTKIIVTRNLVYFFVVGLRLQTLLLLKMFLMSHPEGSFVILLYVIAFYLCFRFFFFCCVKNEVNFWGLGFYFGIKKFWFLFFWCVGWVQFFVGFVDFKRENDCYVNKSVGVDLDCIAMYACRLNWDLW